MGRETGDEEQVTRYRAEWTQVEGQRPRDMRRGTWDKVHGVRDEESGTRSRC